MRRPNYLNAPISRSGLAGIAIGDSLAVVEETLDKPLRRRAGKDPGSAVLILDYRSLGVILEHGNVIAITADPGYEGKTEHGIGVGTSIAELTKHLPGLYFDESRFVWRVREWPSLEIEIGIPPQPRPGLDLSDEPLPEFHELTEPGRAFVISISVTAPPYD